MKRKSFIKNASAILALQTLPSNLFANSDFNINYQLLNQIDKNSEDYWIQMSKMFQVPKDFINLENGYFSPQPISTLAFHQKNESAINQKTSWFMRNEQFDNIEKNRNSLAEFLKCNKEELAITRNTTESLNNVISGFPWKKGDEVIIGNQDYGSMVAAFQQQVQRNGIIVKVAQIPLHPQNDDEIIEAFSKLITPKTKVIHLTHLINLSGQILPASKIIDLAHDKNIQVMVDAAHSVAHIDTSSVIQKADYFAASLHKWLCCPLGVGILKIKQELIAQIYPLMADEDYPKNNIRKFEHQGTKPIQSIIAIEEAIAFHNTIGAEIKENRLRYLKNYWVNNVKNLPKVVINTPTNDSERSCAIANFSIEGYKPTELSKLLLEKYKIFSVAIEHPAINGVRITPHLYTLEKDLDGLVGAIQEFARN